VKRVSFNAGGGFDYNCDDNAMLRSSTVIAMMTIKRTITVR